MGRICLIREGDYPLDPRVRNEVEALVAGGHEVDIICLRRPGQASIERSGKVTVRRLGMPGQRGSWARYVVQYGLFMVAAGMVAGARHLRRRYDLVQVNTMPDTLVFAALIPKLLGARVLLDLHECMPEFTSSKFHVGLQHRSVRFVAWMEQLSIRFADFAITPTAQQREAFVGRGTAPEKVAVILNTHGLMHEPPALTLPLPQKEEESFVLICHGTIEERYGLDTLVRAAALVKDEIPGLRVEIYGDGSYRPVIASLVKDLALSQHVFLSPGFVPLDELLRAIARAQVGIVAMKRDPFRDLTLCNKMFDFIGMRKPAIVSRTRSVDEYFGPSCFEMFTADDPEDLARAIRRLYRDPARRRQLAERALAVSEPYNWPAQRRAYQGIVDSLVAGQRVRNAEPLTRASAPGVTGS